MNTCSACDACLARSWLVQRLGGHLEVVRRHALELLALPGEELLAAIGGADAETIRGEQGGLDPEALRAGSRERGLTMVCRCCDAFPPALEALPAPPAVLYVAGAPEVLAGFGHGSSVAIVGSRAATPYGREVARALARDLARLGVGVVSGMARGIDAAVHAGALEGAGRTLAVLPGSADQPYPARSRRLHAEIVRAGAAVSELGPGASIWRWGFLARNRIIAALSGLTVVVEAGARSGSLAAAELARALKRPVGAVPGRVTSELAAGPNELLARGAAIIRNAQDALDQVYGPGIRTAPSDLRAPPSAVQRALLSALSDGLPPGAALARAGLEAEAGLTALAELELAGWVRLGPGGPVVMP